MLFFDVFYIVFLIFKYIVLIVGVLGKFYFVRSGFGVIVFGYFIVNGIYIGY